jgi:hypothetical protein
MKKSILFSLLLAAIVTCFTSCDKKDNPVPSPDVLVSGIVPLTTNIADWDIAYLTNFGYFTYAKDVNKSEEDRGVYSTISFMTKTGEEMASLIATKADNLPTQLVIRNEGIVYFSFPNDTIVELLFDDGKEVKLAGSYWFPKENLPSFDELLKEDVFKSTLANAAALLRANIPSQEGEEPGEPVAQGFADMFDQVSSQAYTENQEAVNLLEKNAEGNYQFAQILQDWFNNEVSVAVYNTLTLWTGKATFKVGGSSCTLSGTIWCATDTYNDYGTYGIICDADQSKLQLGEAEYEGTGFQPKGALSYDVDFRGFKPNTTYYYRAYYKFNSSDHGTIVPKYGSATDEVIYDTTIKSFTTGDNLLTVDVVMCIDFTGSMGGIINTVKNNALSFYDSFKAKCDNLGIGLTGMTTQVIGYQDINVDGANWWKQSPTYQMPEQREAFTEFVNGIDAMGGGDTPESGLEALNAAFSKSDWGIDDGYHRQVVILWTDAPYLVGSGYTAMTVEGVKAKWDAMPSGRRMILFAPSGNYASNGGDWDVMNDWKNVIHITNLSSGFYDMDYILESIIGELTSKSRSASYSKPKSTIKIVSRPNK